MSTGDAVDAIGIVVLWLSGSVVLGTLWWTLDGCGPFSIGAISAITLVWVAAAWVVGREIVRHRRSRVRG